MAFDDEEMLLDADSTKNPSQESLTNATQAFWALTNGSHAPPTSPTQHSFTLSTVLRDTGTQWLEEDFSPAVEQLSPGELSISVGAPRVSPVQADPKERMISNIECVFESMLDVLLGAEGSPTLFLKSRHRGAVPDDTPARAIRFPGKTSEEAWRFTVLIRILEIVHEALVTGRVVSKREIYYRHPALFVNQQVVDRYVDDIAFTFGASRSSLNVTAAAKGLVVGALTITKADGGHVRMFDDPSGHLVPTIEDGDSIHTTASWILVVEKEAVFRSITASSSWETLKHEGIVVTGKGYPDLSTRTFLHKLSAASTTGYFYVPTYALVDLDPDGLNILLTYKHGSMPLAHEGDGAKVPGLEWLGIRSFEALPTKRTGNVHQDEGLLRLTQRDRRMATNMLGKEHNSEDSLDRELKRELRIMLMLNMKAEIEILESRNGGLPAWLMEHLNI